MHSNTAFALVLSFDYADSVGDDELKDAIVQASRRYISDQGGGAGGEGGRGREEKRDGKHGELTSARVCFWRREGGGSNMEC